MEHVYPEDEVNVSKRVRKFLNTLLNNKITKNERKKNASEKIKSEQSAECVGTLKAGGARIKRAEVTKRFAGRRQRCTD